MYKYTCTQMYITLQMYTTKVHTANVHFKSCIEYIFYYLNLLIFTVRKLFKNLLKIDCRIIIIYRSQIADMHG
jgi:hypothetical protein